MTKNKNKIPYDKNVAAIRAIAFGIRSDKLTIKTLAKALLISKEGRQQLSKKLHLKEYLLRTIYIKPIKEKTKDNPAKAWPEKLFDEEDEMSIFGFDDKEASKQKQEIQKIDLGLLTDKLLEKKDKSFFLKILVADSAEILDMLISEAKTQVNNHFFSHQKEIEALLDIISISYRKSFSTVDLKSPLPVIIFASDGYDHISLFDFLKKVLKCELRIVDFESISSSDYSETLPALPAATVVFQLSTYIQRTQETEALLSYYETGMIPEKIEDSSFTFPDLFGLKDDEAKKHLFEIITQNVVLFLIKIPYEINIDDTVTPMEITGILRNYYENKYRETSIDCAYNNRLLNLVHDYNTVTFTKSSAKDVIAILDSHLSALGLNKLNFEKETVYNFYLLTLLLAGSLNKRSLINAMEYILSKIGIDVLKCEKISFRILDPPDNLINVFFNKEVDENEILKHFEGMIKALHYGNKSFTFDIEPKKQKNEIVISAFKEQIDFRKGNSYLYERPSLRFKDVVGLGEIKDRFKTIEKFYEQSDLFNKLKVKPNNRILLTGKPGTGKTMIAKAFAGEIGLPFFYISAAELTSQKYAGWGGTLLRQIFQDAKQNKPCILFIDELDTIGSRDDLQSDSVGYDAKSIINTLLVELDGIDSDIDIITIAATNRPQDIDPALTRPKRFGTVLNTDTFTAQDRKELIKLKLTPNMCFDDYENILKLIISRTHSDFTPAILEEIIHEAKLLAINNNREGVASQDINRAIDNMVLGRKLFELDNRLKSFIAYHQAGHALLHKIMFSGKRIEKLSVSIYQNSIGIMEVKDDNKTTLLQYSNEDLIKLMLVQIAGAVSEEIKFGSWGTTAGDDWSIVSFIASNIIGNLLINEDLNTTIEYYLTPNNLSERNLNKVKNLIAFCYNTSKRYINEYQIEIELLAGKLIDNGEIYHDQIDSILKNIETYNNNILKEFINYNHSLHT